MLQLQPELAQIKALEIDFYVIAAGQQSELEQFFDLYPVEAFVLKVSDYTLFEAYDIEALPTTVFIDETGRIRETKVGWGSNSLPQLWELVTELAQKE